jgi:molecular chaperone GrpE
MTDHDHVTAAEPTLDTAAAPLDDLATDVAAMRAELDTWRDKAYRAAADLDNFRKRSQTEVAEARLYAAQSFAKDVLTVADNLARALSAPDTDPAALRKGVELTATQFEAILGRHGIKKTDVKVGDALNPELHQAMTEAESNNPAGTIVAELQAGYTLHGRLLRPSLVSVAKVSDNQ